MQSFTPYADAARRLLTQDARVGSWIVGGQTVSISGSPIEAAGVHYAHAAGLSGAGQTITISDNGFLTAHETLAVTLSGTPPVDGHGTFVASVAAGNSANMVGVAPGAGLILGSYSGAASLTDVANLARQHGAVALNNSWAFVGLEANRADYRALFSPADGAAYLAALKSYSASGGVAVWAAPNDYSAAGVGLMAALPVLEPGLEAGWLAVVNGLPTLSGDDVVAARRLSSGCHEAAVWCLAADGSWIGERHCRLRHRHVLRDAHGLGGPRAPGRGLPRPHAPAAPPPRLGRQQLRRLHAVRHRGARAGLQPRRLGRVCPSSKDLEHAA